MGRAQTEPSKKPPASAGKKKPATAATKKAQPAAGAREHPGAGRKEQASAGKKEHGNGGKKEHGNGGHGERDAEGHNPVQVQKFLSGLDYPADRQALVEKARAEGADREVIAVLEKLPERTYDSPVAVSRELGQMK